MHVSAGASRATCATNSRPCWRWSRRPGTKTGRPRSAPISPPRDHLPYAPPANGVLALDAVWEPLDALDPLAKQAMVEAITAAVSHDGRVSVAEAELLRTICAALHCPLPPMLERG